MCILSCSEKVWNATCWCFALKEGLGCSEYNVKLDEIIFYLSFKNCRDDHVFLFDLWFFCSNQ